MFDWEGEELANIWGKAGEKEDHIVPYPDETYEKPPGPCGDHSKLSDHKVANVNLNLAPSTKLILEHTYEKGQLDNVSQIFDNQPDEDRDTSNFVDYNWENVGSFDDLDRILSNNEYGNANILSINSPVLPLGDLRSDCEHVETKSGFIKDANTNLVKMECNGGKNGKIYQFSQSTSNIVRRSPPYVYPVGAVNVAMPSESASSKMGTKDQKYDPWFSLGNQGKESERRYRQHIKVSSSKDRNHETESSPYKQLINPLLSPCGSNITTNQQLTSGSFSLMPLSMTPQEKIEKLRRRQQMQALVAIRKQQQEFRQTPNFTSCSNERQIDESLMVNGSSLEESILHQLENVISTLDIQIRVCIRDSLFRLSQSALKRQYAGDRVSTADVTKEGLGSSTKRSARNPDGETKTNPIDRVVAHLLFHRPHLQSLDSLSSDSRVETEGSSRVFAFFEDLQG